MTTVAANWHSEGESGWCLGAYQQKMSNPVQFGVYPRPGHPKVSEAFHTGLPIAGETNPAAAGAQLGIPPASLGLA